MTGTSLRLKVGERIWFDGQAWSVREIGSQSADLVDSLGTQRRAAVTDLIGNATNIIEESTLPTLGDDLAAVLLSQLTTAQRRQVEKEYELLVPLLQEPVTPVELEAAAAAQGVSTRTLRRRLERATELGPAGLLDNRLAKQTRRSVDPRWDAACREILDAMVNASTPTKRTVIRLANQRFLEAVPDGQIPGKTVAYTRLDELDKGRRTFGEAKQRRSVAHRPTGVLGQLNATRPGEYVLMDGYRLDVFAMEPVTNRWVNTELTVAMDLYDRGIRGIRLRPVAAKAADVASVLFQMMTPQTWDTRPDSPIGPYSGVPENLVIGTSGTFPDTIVVDHGKVYMSNHTAATCRRLGISIQPAIPLKPTDKPAIERFFRTLRTGLLDKLPGYKGPNIASRGLDVEKGAFYYVTELEQIIREWVGEYHQMPHSGLVDPRLPHIELSPNEMHARGMAVAGQLRLPASQDLYYEFLECQWRTIQHYGVEVDGRIYDGPALNAYRGTKSSYGGSHPGKWPFMVDIDDVRTIHFRDPHTGQWNPLSWRQAHLLNAPFSEDAAAYTRARSVQENRHVDPDQAIQDLLARWSRDETLDRRQRNLALRLAAQATAPNGQSDRILASNPGVIDLVTTPRRLALKVVDDVDVFERYYLDHPQDHQLEVFDE